MMVNSKEFKKWKKQEIQNIFTEMNKIKLVFNMIWPASEKVLRDKSFNIAKNPKYDWYQRDIASMVYDFFIKKSSGSVVMSNQQIADKLHKPIIKNFFLKKHIHHLKTMFGLLI